MGSQESYGLRSWVWGFGFRVWGLGFRGWGSGGLGSTRNNSTDPALVDYQNLFVVSSYRFTIRVRV